MKDLVLVRIFILSLVNYECYAMETCLLYYWASIFCRSVSYKLDILFWICRTPIIWCWWFIMIIIAADSCTWFCFNVVANDALSIYAKEIFRCTELLFFVCTKILYTVAVRKSCLFIGLLYLEGRNFPKVEKYSVMLLSILGPLYRIIACRLVLGVCCFLPGQLL
jgi:hypothetical protein